MSSQTVERQGHIKVAIIAGASIQMITIVMSSGLSALQEAFPAVSTLMIQLSSCGNGIAVIILSFFTSWIFRRFTRRKSALFGIALLPAAALPVYFFHSSIWIVFWASVLIGIGTVLFTPAISSVIIDCFGEEQRQKLAGLQSGMASAGGILLSLLGGALATVSWYTSYLGLLVVLVPFAICLFCFPKDVPVQASGEGYEPLRTSKKLSPAILKYGLLAGVTVILQTALNSNMALFMASEGIGTSAAAGMVLSSSMVGGVLGGILYGRLERFGDGLFAAGYGTMALAYGVLALSYSIPACIFSAVLIGAALSVNMPHAIFSMSKQISPDQCVLGSSILTSFAPQAASIISPLLLTKLSLLLFGNGMRARFGLIAALALLCAAVLAVMAGAKHSTR